jgi:TolB-like protein/Flp pilus assembly protein TadD/limonene-1,2-epoxide hydrolase
MSEDFQATSTPRPIAPDAAADTGALHDVFVSYASQDASVANSIVAALERSGLKCWIAPRDVPPGTQYADVIIRAINGTRVLVLVLSEHSVSSAHVGKEIERASAKGRPIIALRTDAKPLTPALEYFLSESQWIDVGTGGVDAAAAKLAEAVRRLIAYPTGVMPPAAAAVASGAKPRVNRPILALIAVAAVVAAVLAYVVIDKMWLAKRAAPVSTETAASSESATSTGTAPAKPAGAAPAFAPPPHSIAVLPFVNMSGDPKQDYFSDGLSEELLNSLTTIPDLQVAARTSSFFFKGKEVDLSEVAHKLNVGAVLEGSVRKDGEHVRITAQLINAVTGFHLWSQTYDRDLKGIFKLQTEIATAVTKALQATLMADAAATIELGGTRNPKAFDAYLAGKNLEGTKINRDVVLARIAAFDEAIRLDPGFAKAHSGKSLSETGFAEYYGVGPEIREHFERARAAAERSVQLAPDLGEAHSALADVLGNGYLDFTAALAEHERALALSPNDASVLLRAAWFLADLGRSDEAVAMARRGVSLDQLNFRAYRSFAIVLDDAHRYPEAIEAANRALSLNPNDLRQTAIRGLAILDMGDAEAARKSCDTPPLDWESRMCLAIAYDKLHRRPEAEAQVSAMNAELGDASAYQYSEIYAQWGDIPKALDWIEAAYRLKDPGIRGIKMDAFLAPLRAEPRFQEVVRKLNFPS